MKIAARENEPHYLPEDLQGKTPVEIADAIVDFREDDGLLGGAAFDLLNAIEPYLRNETPNQWCKVFNFPTGQVLVKKNESDEGELTVELVTVVSYGEKHSIFSYPNIATQENNFQAVTSDIAESFLIDVQSKEESFGL